ncbi:MAG TPA: N-acetylmuramoyl-L-alanine amidase [Saprospiraceae bacterium]|nr:N-acetylmuramoyl-L-alanine amidase [Saprospiraceae bacterium]
MKRTLPLLLLLLSGALAGAQSSRAALTLRNISQEAPQSRSIPMAGVTPFLAWSAVWSGEAEGLWFRFSADGRHWEPWIWTGPEIHAAELPGRTVGQLRFENAAMRYFQVRSEATVDEVVVHFFNPGPDAPATTAQEAESAELLACPCPQPAFQRRSDWCPAGNCPPNPNPSYTDVTHLIVHHSASANTAASWAAVVRSFWDFHVNTNGWADIGYNWLIDPNGVVYEGRGDNVLGAHFCGTNSRTMGVCVIGDFTSVVPTQAALDQLRNLLSWKACNINADPLSTLLHTGSGLTLNRISGHRDGVCSTSCPGNMLYPLLPNIRQNVANHIAQVCSVSDAEEAEPHAAHLHIFPNPARDIIRIEAEGMTGLAWLELVQAGSGAVLQRLLQPEAAAFDVSVADLPAGLYWLRLSSAGGEERRGVFVVLQK